MKREYYRHLPHLVPNGVPIFLTWNLKGAFPKEVRLRFEREFELSQREAPRADETSRERAMLKWKQLFAKADKYLDSATSGPLLLADEDAAQIVQKTILNGSGDDYLLWAWCVMANHVHTLLTPRIELARITQKLKGGTAFVINRMQGQRGRTLWQGESYDHWVRDEHELLRIIHYIENNPVRAGLCAEPSEWVWSSTGLRDHWRIGEPYSGFLQERARKPVIRQAKA
jgi:putative transposase